MYIVRSQVHSSRNIGAIETKSEKEYNFSGDDHMKIAIQRKSTDCLVPKI